MSSVRFAPVQWLRALAATLVVTVHAANLVDSGPVVITGKFFPSVPNLGAFGVSGVDLFFVISGFVMAHSLSTAGRDPVRFLMLRWRRIVPIFALVSAAYILITPDPLTIDEIVMSVTVLPIFDGADYHQPALYVGWTLGFEFAFYALVALAMTAARHRIAILLTVTICAALVGGVVHPGWAPARMMLNPLMFEFALGVLAWMAWRRGITVRIAGPMLVAGITLLAIGIAFGLGPFVTGDVQPAVAGTSGYPRVWTWGIPWTLVLVGVIDTLPSGRFERLVARIGDASYSTYLVHPCLIALLYRVGGHLPPVSAGLFVAGFVIVSNVAGLVLHRWVERPLMDLIARPRRAPVDGAAALA